MKVNKMIMMALACVGFLLHTVAFSTCVQCGCTGQMVNRYYVSPTNTSNTCTSIIRDKTTGPILSYTDGLNTKFGTVCSRCGHLVTDHNYAEQNGLSCGISATEKLSTLAVCNAVTTNGTVTGSITAANCTQ